MAIIERWNLLIVHQTEQNHRLIHELLDAIQRVVAARHGKMYLENLHGIQIELDLRALAENAISVDKPIDKQLSNISLRSALDLSLRDLGLSHTLRNGVVLITTPDALETLETTKVYDLSNVVSP